MCSTVGKVEFKVRYKVFDRKDENLIVFKVLCWKLEGCEAFGCRAGLGLAGEEF